MHAFAIILELSNPILIKGKDLIKSLNHSHNDSVAVDL